MRRFIQLLICSLVITSTALAGGGKGFASKLYFQLGGTIGADVMRYEGIFCKNSMASNIQPIPFSATNVNYATLMGVGRVNFLEISNNASLSLAMRPNISFGRAYGDGGGTTTMIRLPFTLDFNSGAAATVSTRAKTGFSFGVGAEFIKYPLGNAVDVAAEKEANGVNTSTGRYINMKAAWWQPVAVVGVKFFGKHYLCRELNFKASFCSMGELDNQTTINTNNNGQSLYGTIYDWKTVGLTISFLQYLNY